MNDQDTHVGVGASTTARVPLVDRRRELGELDAALTAACAGRGQMFLIAGEPGIGKTRLAEAIAERGAENEMIALWARAWETGGAPSYWPWVEALRTLIATRDAATLNAELGQDGTWLIQILPELRDRLPDLEPPRSAGMETARFALFDAVTSFLRTAAASTPLVIVVDDLHASDAASLLLLEFLAHGIAQAQILLLGTYQQAAAARRPEVEKLIGALARECPTLALGGFAEGDLGLMVEHAVGKAWPVEAVGALHQITEGNPFFSAEMIRLLATEGKSISNIAPAERARFPMPDTVRETVRRRFLPLDPSTIAALEPAAVIGREFRLSTLELIVSEPDRLLERVDEAAAAGLVREVPGSIGRFRFTHNLIRETLYTGLGTGRRVHLHAAVGNALERRRGAAAEGLAELAHHFTQAAPAGDAHKAVEYATKAGAEAMRLLAYEQAADLYRLALDASEQLAPDPQRRAGLMLSWARAVARSDHLAGRDALLAAAGAARDAEEPRLFAEAALSMRAWPRGGGVLDDQPSAVLNEALERLGDGDDVLRARLLARLATALYYWTGTEERRKSLVEEAVTIARRVGDPGTLAHVLSNGQFATWGPDHTERDLDWMEELLVLIAQMGGDDELELATRNRQIDFLVELGDLPAADAALRALELKVGDSSDPRTEGYVHLQHARHAVIEGRYGEAERLNAHAVRIGSRLRDMNMLALAGNQAAGIRWLQGRFEEVEPQIRDQTTKDVTPAWQAALVRVSCDVGREAEARRVLERLATNDFADLPRYNGWLATLALLSEACIKLGDLRRVEALYELLKPFETRNVTTPQAVFAGPVARFLGILAAARMDWEAAGSHFERARAAAARMNAPPVLMRVNLDEAAMLARRDGDGDRARALELVGEARPIAAELGLERIGEQLEALAAEVGAPELVPTATSVTPAEASVASLRREGDFWTFKLGSRSVRLRDSKGVRYIAFLLTSPGVEVHAMALAAAGAPRGAPGRLARDGDRLELGVSGAADAGPLLDAAAKEAYRRRLEDLREDVEEAESFNDPERAARAREEIDFLQSELAGAVGLGGRDRKAASTAERARVSVTKAIRATVKRIHQYDPMLARELETTVRTGTFCVHEPDPRHPLEWKVDAGPG